MRDIHLAAFVYPAWHPTPYRGCLGPEWTEWELVQSAKPLFPGHHVVDVPLWGAYDDTDEKVVERQIATALGHGIQSFVFDAYWDHGPVLSESIDAAFLKRSSETTLLFALNLSPRLPRRTLPLPLSVDDACDRRDRDIADLSGQFIEWVEHCSMSYFGHGNYWRHRDCPVIFLFQYDQFVARFGGPRRSREIFRVANDILRSRGLGQLYVVGTTEDARSACQAKAAGLSALTSYNLLPAFDATRRPIQPFAAATRRQKEQWHRIGRASNITYLPSVAVGFDASCRGEWSGDVTIGGTSLRYPWYPIVDGYDAAIYRRALSDAASCARSLGPELATVMLTAWNEWSEGCALEPGKARGHDALSAVVALPR